MHASWARDVLVGSTLALYVYLVVFLLAKNHFYAVSKTKGEVLARYLTRKFIHIVAAGPVSFLVPLVFSEPIIPAILSLLFALILYRSHRSSPYYWFQEETNKSEVIFAVSWSGSILALWWISPWLVFFPVFALSIGDGVTGYIRGLRHGRRIKSWDGTIAMLLATAIPGAIAMGLGGLLAGVAASLAERNKYIDDNIAIPVAAIIAILVSRIAGFS